MCRRKTVLVASMDEASRLPTQSTGGPGSVATGTTPCGLEAQSTLGQGASGLCACPQAGCLEGGSQVPLQGRAHARPTDQQAATGAVAGVPTTAGSRTGPGPQPAGEPTHGHVSVAGKVCAYSPVLGTPQLP